MKCLPLKLPKRRKHAIILWLCPKSPKRRESAAAPPRAGWFRLVMTAVFVLAGLCGNIALRLQINELNSEINDVKSVITELESEKTSLEMEMQKKISYANLELEATQLGMRKMEKSDVKYIRVNDKDKAVKSDGSTVTAE